jgi:hypothetical protein
MKIKSSKNVREHYMTTLGIIGKAGAIQAEMPF